MRCAPNAPPRPLNSRKNPSTGRPRRRNTSPPTSAYSGRKRRHPPSQPAGEIVAESLDDAALARFGDPGRQEISLFSMIDCLALQIFPNLFLGETAEINGFRREKLGFIIF